MADHSHHHHHHGHDHSLPVMEEPLDPANKSLSDALRVSFRMLKLAMIVVLGFYLLSNFRSVEEQTVQVRWRLGKYNETLNPGLHLSFPTPVDRLIEVRTNDQTFTITAFNPPILPAANQEYSQLRAPRQHLDPATDGALLTADNALWHVTLVVRYHIADPAKFVENVKMTEQEAGEDAQGGSLAERPAPEQSLMRPIIRAASVAEAARTPSGVIWKNPSRLAQGILNRAQQELDELETGIALKDITAQSYYPMQTSRSFASVLQAETRTLELTKTAETEAKQTLKGAAGKNWKKISAEIDRLETAESSEDKKAAMDEIRRLLKEEAEGEASRIVSMANANSARTVDEARGRVATFNAFLDEYAKSPDLIRQRQIHRTLRKVLSQPDMMRWVMPSTGDVKIYLNEDALQLKEIQEEAARLRAERQRQRQ